MAGKDEYRFGTLDMQYYPNIKSPSYVLEEAKLRKNLELIQEVQEASGASVILALKGFALWKVFPFLKQFLGGATASSLNEARLVFEEMGLKAHTYAPVYIPQEFEEILQFSSHITFNSLNQFEFYKDRVLRHHSKVSLGLRVNPECSVVETDLYNPAAPDSRLGLTADHLSAGLPEGIEGLHFHVLCESSAADLEKVLLAFEEKFSHLFAHLRWINFGGGHLMTKSGYKVNHLIQILRDFQAKYGLKVILEPGSAIAWQTGFLLCTVLDIVENGGVKTLMTDISFTAHMPDTLEMPYRPKIREAKGEGKGPFQYRIGGISCLAGDFMEAYSFEQEIRVGDQLIFEDMLHYTTVKTTMFNGINHPRISMLKEDGMLEVFRTFTYEDYKNRMA